MSTVSNSNFIDFHVLVSHPASSINRDQHGSQKTMVFGGEERARVSSQSLKQAIRTSAYFKQKLGTKSDRTRELGKLVNNYTESLKKHDFSVVRKTIEILSGKESIEVDGKGTAIITESCVLNPNRNPGLGKADCEAELNRLLGIRKVIWLPGIAGKDITDGHTDFYARFARPGTVIAAFDADPASYDHAVTQRHLEILRGARDADNQPLQVTVIEAPAKVRPEYDHQGFAAGYINFYLANGAVLVPEFGDEQADANAKARLMQLYPGRTIVQLNIDPIAAGGGGIHCTTQQQPA